MSSPRETLSVRADQQKKHGRKRRLTVWLLSGGALSLIALFAFGYGLEAYLARDVQRRMAERGFKVSWRASSWGLGRACVEELKWLHPQAELHGSIQALCVRGRWRLAWPPVSAEHVQVYQAKVVASIDALSSLGRSGSAGERSAAPPRAVSELRRLSSRLPVDLDVEGASLWLTRAGESVASVALSLKWRPLVAAGEPSASLQAQARLRGLERPLDIKGTLSDQALILRAPSAPWRLISGERALSLGGLKLSLKSRTVQFMGLELRSTLLGTARLEGLLSPMSRELHLGPGELTLARVPQRSEELRRELSAIREELSARLIALDLDFLRQRKHAPPTANQRPELEGLSTGGWRLRCDSLKMSVAALGDSPLLLRLDELSLSDEGLMVQLHEDAQRLGPTAPSLWACLGAPCERAYVPSPWRVELKGLELERLLARPEVSAALSSQPAQLSELLKRLTGELSLSAKGSRTSSGLGGLEELSATLSGGALRLSPAEPPASLPSLTLTVPRLAEASNETPFQLLLSSASGATAALTGSLERTQQRDAPSSYQLSLRLTELPCQRAAQLIPKEALGPIESLSLKGSLAPRLSASYREGQVDFKLKGLLRSCTFEGMRLARPRGPAQVKVDGRPAQRRDVLWLKERFTFEVDQELTGGERVLVGPGAPSFVRLSELPSYIPGAMYLTEEMGFWTGGAISPALIKSAINTNLSKGRFVYGGSTVTQQLVKNLFLSRDKLLTRKLQEALISARVIDAIGKERILELYLNCIEFGPGVFGIQEAARYYFQKDARSLSPQQAVFLAMLKVSPARGARWRRRGSSPSFTWWRARSVEVFKRLVDKGLLSARQAQGQAPFILKWSKNGDYIGAQLIEP